jgi:predicted PurR-regulated permease PerM
MINRAYILLALALLTGVGLVLILSGYWKPIFWAIVFAVLFKPLLEWISVRTGNRRSLATALTMTIAAVFIFIPALYFGSAIVSQAVEAVALMESGTDTVVEIVDTVEETIITTLGVAPGGLSLDAMRGRIEGAINEIGTWLVNLIFGAGQGAALFVIHLGLMLYLLFFLLRDGEEIFVTVSDSIPLSGDQKDRFFDRFAVVAVATIKGTLVVSIVQGALGGTIFAILGIKGALFWGAVMSLLAILPALGAAIIWFPAAVLLAINGDWVRALILVAFGTLVISLVDNLLRPVLVGRDAKMPDWLVLFATVGGLATFGITGFVAGPVLAALFIVSWQMLRESTVL